MVAQILFTLNMRLIVLISLLFFSCDTDNCDLSEYPSSPLSEPYAVQYGDDWVEYTYVFYPIISVLYRDDWVEYTYVCIDGYNEIWTYRIEQGCWEGYRDTQWNSRC